MNDPRVDDLLKNPIARALMSGGFMLPLNPQGARSDNPGGPAVNVYESGATIVIQVYAPTAKAWRSVTLS